MQPGQCFPARRAQDQFVAQRRSCGQVAALRRIDKKKYDAAEQSADILRRRSLTAVQLLIKLFQQSFRFLPVFAVLRGPLSVDQIHFHIIFVNLL